MFDTAPTAAFLQKYNIPGMIGSMAGQVPSMGSGSAGNYAMPAVMPRAIDVGAPIAGNIGGGSVAPTPSGPTSGIPGMVKSPFTGHPINLGGGMPTTGMGMGNGMPLFRRYAQMAQRPQPMMGGGQQTDKIPASY